MVANQLIQCSVSYCRYNEHGEVCSLNQIVVQAQVPGGSGEPPEHPSNPFETFCGSYDPK